MHEVAVSAVRQLTPRLRRITLAADSLHCFRDDGPDQRFTLLLPRPGQDAPLLPDTSTNWYQSWLAMPADKRPVLRTYTVREARPLDGELDVDIVTHGELGPGSAWATSARPGDRVAIFGAYAEYEADPDDTHLIVGDHCALPAVAAIVERLWSVTRGHVVVEVPSADEQLPLTTPPALHQRWVDVVPGRPGAALIDAVQALPEGETVDYAWVAADRDTVATIRRHLVRGRGLSPEQVMFTGYWRTDGAIDDL